MHRQSNIAMRFEDMFIKVTSKCPQKPGNVKVLN
jgi:hypothetical protein